MSEVPALAYQPKFEFDPSDVKLSTLYVGQLMSKAAQNDLAKLGDIYVAAGADDPNAEVVWKSGSKEDGILFYVLSYEKRLFATVDGDFRVFNAGDPAAPADAKPSVTYTVAAPQVDDILPLKFTLKSTGLQTAQRINTVLAKAQQRGDIVAFRLTSIIKESSQGKYAVLQASVAEVTEQDLAIVNNVASVVAATPSRQIAESSEAPAI